MMAGKTYTLEIVTPERLVFSGEVVSLSAPGVEGGFGVLANHTSFMSALESGVIRIEDALGAETRIAISGGFFEVSKNHAIVLADAAEVGAEVDPDRARAALQRAKELLSHPTAGIDLDRARRAARRAEARLKVAGQGSVSSKQ